MQLKRLSEIEAKTTGLVSYDKISGHFVFKLPCNEYDYYCRTLQDLADMIRHLSNKNWYSIEIQRDVFNLYDNIVRK